MMRLCIAAAIPLLVALPALADDDAPGTTKPVDRAALEKKFAETLSGATMTGHFTVTGQEEKDASPQEERYEIGKVKKLQNDYWLIEARIKYGKHDSTLPLTLQVFWAGDTPVITLTNLPVPGFGTFTARVLVYGDQYAGTWNGANHGGHLFGKITPGDDTKDKEK